MVDFLFALGQSLCGAGLLYGAYLSISCTPDDMSSPALAKFKYLATHARNAADDALEQRVRRVSE